MTKAATLLSLRILVAEDEYWVAMDLADDPRDMGAEVIAVEGSLAEVRRATECAGRTDVAVLDINLRGELVDELIARQVPVVLATGYSEEAIPARYAGIARCNKPICAGVLAKAVRQAVGTPTRKSA